MYEFEKELKLEKLKRIQERLKIAIIFVLIVAVLILMFTLVAIKLQVFQDYEMYLGIATLILFVVYITLKQMWFMIAEAIRSIK